MRKIVLEYERVILCELLNPRRPLMLIQILNYYRIQLKLWIMEITLNNETIIRNFREQKSSIRL